MANRFWRGGAGTWDASATTNWSTSSGGAGGASAPTTSDDAIFDTNSGLTNGLVVTINGGTANNVTITQSAVKSIVFALASNVTITGTWSATGNSAVNRIFIQSSVLGTTRTLTAAAASLTNVDFMDITGAGAASWTGTSIGNALGNTNITFTTPVSRYLKAAGNWSSTAVWSATSGGTAGASVPLPQDNVFGDATAGAGTYTIDMPRIGANIDLTGFTRTLSNGVGHDIFGNVTLSSAMTYSGTSILTMRGRGSHTITTNTKVCPNGWSMMTPGGTYTLQDVYNNNLRTFDNSGGIFNTGNFNMNVGAFINNSSSPPAGSGQTLGTSTITCNAVSGNIFFMRVQYTTSAPFTTVIFTDSGAGAKSFQGAGAQYGILSIAGGGAGVVNIQASNTFLFPFTISGGGTKSVVLQAGTTQTFLQGTNFGNGTDVLTLTTTVSGTPATLASVYRLNADYLNLKDITASRNIPFYAGANSVDSGNNANWIFRPMPMANFTPFF